MVPTHIVIHHSLTADAGTVSWGAIRRYHVETNGWSDIGYHYGLELVGDRHEILVGRPMTDYGAHCKEGGMNRCSLGICVVGNYDVADLPEEAFRLLVRHVRSLCQIAKIPYSNIHRHAEFAPYKSCPGKRFPWQGFMDALRGGPLTRGENS